jgi:hypothetical protein
VAADGTAATTMFELAVILLVTVSVFNVPMLVKLDWVIVAGNIDPVNVPAAAGTVIF